MADHVPTPAPLGDEGFARVLAAMDAHLYIAEIDPEEGYRDVYTGPGDDLLLGGVLPLDVAPGEAWSDRVHADDLQSYRAAMELAHGGHAAEVEYRLLGYDGVTRWVRERCRPHRDGDGRLRIDGLVVDVTSWREIESGLRGRLQAALEAMTEAHQEAEMRSRTDSLTGVFNRRHFGEMLAAELSRAERERSTPGVLVLDIDHFKRINDAFGHQAGDEVLVEAAARIRLVLRPYDSIARWGGEEFVILAPAIPDDAVLGRVGEQLRRSIATRPFEPTGMELEVTASVGAVRTSDTMRTPDEVIDAADQALYAAKRRGRNRVCLFAEVTRDDLAAVEPEAVRLAQAVALSVNVRTSVRDSMPEPHAEQVADLSSRIATEIGLPASTVLRCRIAGWLHDVGKGALPDQILAKPGRLTEDEEALMRAHPVIGAELVARIAGLEQVAPILRSHHERVDGTGYPDGLHGGEIQIEARILAAAEAYSAITAGRVYEASRGQSDALEELERHAGSQFDPPVIDALRRVLEVEHRRVRDMLGLEVPFPG